GVGKQFLPACHLEDSVGQLLESVQIGNGINRSLDEGLGLSKSLASLSLQDPLRFLGASFGASLGASLSEDLLVGHGLFHVLYPFKQSIDEFVRVFQAHQD